jgi:hypothetical protein
MTLVQYISVAATRKPIIGMTLEDYINLANKSEEAVKGGGRLTWQGHLGKFRCWLSLDAYYQLAMDESEEEEELTKEAFCKKHTIPYNGKIRAKYFNMKVHHLVYDQLLRNLDITVKAGIFFDNVPEKAEKSLSKKQLQRFLDVYGKEKGNDVADALKEEWSREVTVIGARDKQFKIVYMEVSDEEEEAEEENDGQHDDGKTATRRHPPRTSTLNKPVAITSSSSSSSKRKKTSKRDGDRQSKRQRGQEEDIREEEDILEDREQQQHQSGTMVENTDGRQKGQEDVREQQQHQSGTMVENTDGRQKGQEDVREQQQQQQPSKQGAMVENEDVEALMSLRTDKNQHANDVQMSIPVTPQHRHEGKESSLLSPGLEAVISKGIENNPDYNKEMGRWLIDKLPSFVDDAMKDSEIATELPSCLVNLLMRPCPGTDKRLIDLIDKSAYDSLRPEKSDTDDDEVVHVRGGHLPKSLRQPSPQDCFDPSGEGMACGIRCLIHIIKAVGLQPLTEEEVAEDVGVALGNIFKGLKSSHMFQFFEKHLPSDVSVVEGESMKTCGEYRPMRELNAKTMGTDIKRRFHLVCANRSYHWWVMEEKVSENGWDAFPLYDPDAISKETGNTVSSRSRSRPSLVEDEDDDGEVTTTNQSATRRTRSQGVSLSHDEAAASASGIGMSENEMQQVDSFKECKLLSPVEGEPMLCSVERFGGWFATKIRELSDKAKELPIAFNGKGNRYKLAKEWVLENVQAPYCGISERLFNGPGASTLGDVESCYGERHMASALINDFIRVLHAHLDKTGVSGCLCLNAEACTALATEESEDRRDKCLEEAIGDKLSNMNKLLIPVQVNGDHWVLSVIDFEERKVHVLDSKRDYGVQHIDTIRLVVVDMVLRWLLQKRGDDGPPFDTTSSWFSPDLPQQKKDRCGAFVCWWMYMVCTRGIEGAKKLEGVDELWLSKAVGHSVIHRQLFASSSLG